MAKNRGAAHTARGKKGVVVDRMLKARWAAGIARYRAARGEQTAGWDERFEALGEIIDADPPLYLAGGFATARSFLRAEAPDLSERQARTYIRVARYFDAGDEARYGVTRLETLIDYLEAAGGVPLAPAKIHPERQKVRVRRGKVERRVPFPEVTSAELRAAVRSARGGRGHAQDPPPVKALRKAIAGAGVRGVAVRLRGGRFDVTGIRPERLAAVGRALTRAKLPEPT